MRFDYERSECPDQTDSYNEEFIGRQPFTYGYDMPEGTEPGRISIWRHAPACRTLSDGGFVRMVTPLASRTSWPGTPNAQRGRSAYCQRQRATASAWRPPTLRFGKPTVGEPRNTVARHGEGAR